jgi:hypothetical protein
MRLIQGFGPMPLWGIGDKVGFGDDFLSLPKITAVPTPCDYQKSRSLVHLHSFGVNSP